MSCKNGYERASTCAKICKYGRNKTTGFCRPRPRPESKPISNLSQSDYDYLFSRAINPKKKKSKKGKKKSKKSKNKKK
jgi:hypothetical protein